MPRFPSGGQGVKQKQQGPAVKQLLICTLVSAVLLMVSLATGNGSFVGALRSGVAVVVSPLRSAAAVLWSPLEGLGNIVSNVTASGATLSDLAAENAELRAENSKLKEYEQTAQDLQALLDLSNTYDLTATAARVVANASSGWEQTITINKGSNDGLAVGMPVTDGNGVLGQISICNPTTSVVRLITDEASGVAAMDQATRAQGQLTGSADGTLYLTLVRTDQVVNVGDNVVTTGLGGTYPKGLPLGTVTSVEKATGALYYTIVVKPVASVSSAEEVLVITSLTAEQRPTEEERAEADAQEKGTSTAAADAAAAAAAENTSEAASDASN
jgi:rod shape-determining protein MreC